jgi:saccharopine dehydrogenase-like NADP-dependent oxidoreductase
MKKVVVLGAGMVGRAIALDLEPTYHVTAVDIDPSQFHWFPQDSQIQKATADLSDKKIIQKIISKADLVIGAVPGFMGYKTLKTVIEHGKSIVDISFFNEDPFDLDSLAKERGVTAIIDCGVAPGMSNMILGYHHHQINVNSFECYVGGLPFKRIWPFKYKAPFSPVDVIEEYIRPARLKVNGRIIEKEALTEPELIDVDEIGTLEAFNTDGLRTLLKTVDIPNMKEKTMRYPGHREYMQVLKEFGFFSKEPLTLQGQTISPIDMTSYLLKKSWEMDPHEPEFTAMKIIITGEDNHINKRIEYTLFDRFDEKTGVSSMARTTGYTCTGTANLILQGKIVDKGLFPPERIGAHADWFLEVLDYIKSRGIQYIRKDQIEP